MASASTVLRQKLLTQGEATGAWASPNNTNLGILESAITGTETITTTSGTVTLTNVDYTNDQSKKAILDVTSTLVGNLAIVIPSASKTYKVLNRTSGSYTLTVKVSGGSVGALTAVEITQGTAAEVYCDGTYVRFATPMVVYGTGAVSGGSGVVASAVAVTPTGNLASASAQAALQELQTDIDTINSTLVASYQPLDTQLTDIAALSAADSNIIVGNGSTWVAESGATARTSLGLAIGTNVQAYDADLAALAGVTSAADKVPYFTGSGTADVATLTSAARTVLDDTTVAAMCTTLGAVDVIGLQVFTTDDTYTPTTGMTYCLVIATAGGGGGGGADGDGSSSCGASGGGAGGTSISLLSAATVGASKAVDIGAGGGGGSTSGGDGTAGSNTTLGTTVVVAVGGDGGTGVNATVVGSGAAGASGGGIGSATGTLKITGGGSGAGRGGDPLGAVSGVGGASFWGGGGRGQVRGDGSGAGSTAGADGAAYGSGGSGGVNVNTATGVAGGDGKAGAMMIIEFC